MAVKKGMYLEQIVVSNENGLPELLREVADYIEKNNLDLWEILINTELEEGNKNLYARLIPSGFVNEDNFHPLPLS